MSAHELRVNDAGQTTLNGIPVNGLDLVDSVFRFNSLAQTVPPGHHFNADRVGFHTGMQLEEMAEKITTIAGGCVDKQAENFMLQFANIMGAWGKEFKAGKHHGAVLRCDRESLLDDDIDVAVVTMGSLMYQTPQFVEAIGAVLVANAAKVPGGVATRDANGKIQKPEGWQKPNLAPFVSHYGE